MASDYWSNKFIREYVLSSSWREDSEDLDRDLYNADWNFVKDYLKWHSIEETANMLWITEEELIDEYWLYEDYYDKDEEENLDFYRTDDYSDVPDEDDIQYQLNEGKSIVDIAHEYMCDPHEFLADHYDTFNTYAKSHGLEVKDIFEKWVSDERF